MTATIILTPVPPAYCRFTTKQKAQELHRRMTRARKMLALCRKSFKKVTYTIARPGKERWLLIEAI
jgi:hypothetical protein